LQHIAQVRSNVCPICQQRSNCLMQRTKLAAVKATDKQLIALWYLMRISALLAFALSAQSISNQVNIRLLSLFVFSRSYAVYHL